MESRQIARNALLTTLITLLASISLYGIAFTWGAIYHDTRLEIWGLPSGMFPLSTQHTYLQAIMPASMVATAPTIWADNTLGYWFPVALLALIGLAAAAARFYTWSGLEAWWTRPRPEPRELSDVDRRMVRWGSWPFRVVLVWFAASLIVALLTVVLVAPPLYAARHDGERAWAKKDYLTWPEVTWTDENSQGRHGFLYGCAGSWCGIVNADGAEVVDAAKVKRIFKKAERRSAG